MHLFYINEDWINTIVKAKHTNLVYINQVYIYKSGILYIVLDNPRLLEYMVAPLGAMQGP